MYWFPAFWISKRVDRETSRIIDVAIGTPPTKAYWSYKECCSKKANPLRFAQHRFMGHCVNMVPIGADDIVRRLEVLEGLGFTAGDPSKALALEEGGTVFSPPGNLRWVGIGRLLEGSVLCCPAGHVPIDYRYLCIKNHSGEPSGIRQQSRRIDNNVLEVKAEVQCLMCPSTAPPYIQKLLVNDSNYHQCAIPNFQWGCQS
jgi:hypothetical protein